MLAAAVLEGAEEDGVFAEKSGGGGGFCNRPSGDEDGGVGVFDFFAEAAQFAHVLLSAYGVNDGPGREEEQGFEKGVGHQVEDAGGECAYAASQEHVAELADGGIGEDALDVGLHQADGGGEEGGGAADHGDDYHGGFRVGEKDIRARDDVDARRDHGGRVNQRADWRGAFHGVGKPNVERKLRRFSAGA